MMYVTKTSIPRVPCLCDLAPICIYAHEGGGVCQDPHKAYGNSDARCHKMRPREVLKLLTLADTTSTRGNRS